MRTMYDRVLLLVLVVTTVRSEGQMACPDTPGLPCECSSVGNVISTLEIDCDTRRLNSVLDLSAFRGFPIEFLSLSRNNIRELPARFLDGLLFQSSHPGQDPVIDLSDNPIQDIADAAFEGISAPDGMGIRMQKCQIEKVPHAALSRMPNWTFVFVGDNRIMSLYAGDFDGMPKLRQISLGNNALMEIDPRAFAGVENSLTKLLLEQNDLATFPDEALKNLANLTLLNLEDNPISDIPADSFRKFKTKQQMTINLESNGLSKLPTGIFKDVRFTLETLNLANNQIEKVEFLEDYCLPVYAKMPTVDLADNPLECDCKLYEILESGRMSIEGTCASPPEQEDNDIKSMFQEEAQEQCEDQISDVTCPKVGSRANQETFGRLLYLLIFCIFFLS